MSPLPATLRLERTCAGGGCPPGPPPEGLEVCCPGPEKAPATTHAPQKPPWIGRLAISPQSERPARLSHACASWLLNCGPATRIPPKRNKCMCPQKYLFQNVLAAFFIITKNWKQPKTINRRMGKQNVVQMYHEILTQQ